MDFAGALISAVIGATGWVIFSFVGTPIRKFWDLRGEIVLALNKYARAVCGPPSETILMSAVVSPQLTRAPAAQEFQRLGLALLAFWQNEALARIFLRLVGFNGEVGARMLLTMAEAAMSTATLGPRREEITRPLRLKI